MDEYGEFKLIQAIDPTTKNVPIRDRFAKLTLSSNKKQKEMQVNQNAAIDQSSVKRSLQFEGNSKNENCASVNPLLKSDSDSVIDNENQEETLLDESAMEPLQISEIANDSVNGEYAVDVLSQKISCLTMDTNEKEATLVRLSKSTSDLSAVEVTTSASLTTDESAITISSEGSKLTSVDYNVELKLLTSDIPLTGETADAALPCTLSNDRVDRIEKFLQDISQHRADWQVDLTAVEFEDNTAVEKGEIHSEKTIKATILANADTESMSGLSFREVRRSLAAALEDTVAMTETHLSFFEKDSLPQNVEKESNSLTGNGSRCFALDETEINTQCSNPDSSAVTIPETESECTSEDLQKSNESIKSKALSDSYEDAQSAVDGDIGTVDLSIQKSKQQMEFGSINISAQINIKIQISHLVSESSGSENNTDDENNDRKDSNQASIENTVTHGYCEEQQQNINQKGKVNDERENDEEENTVQECDEKGYDEEENDVQECDGKEIDEDEHGAESEVVEKKSDFIDQAEKLLNQLYGQSWQTPEVIRTLKRTNNKEQKHLSGTINETEKFLRSDVGTKDPKQITDESFVDDFSIFQRNIASTNLDSTRLTNIKAPLYPKDVSKTEPRQRSKASTVIRRDYDKQNKEPQTEIKNRETRPARRAKIECRQELVYDSSDSKENYASDDSDVDRTEDSQNSDSSWSGKSYVDSDASNNSLDEKEKKKASINRKHPQARNKPFYRKPAEHGGSLLENTPKSPKANRNQNFKTNLANILQTCRVETKPKLPATPASTGKSKRKLFTLNFGDEEDKAPLEHPETPKFNKRTYTYDDECILIDDSENINKNVTDFKVLDKRVNALKDDAKLIFPLTPPKTIQTPKSVNRKAQKQQQTPTNSVSKVPQLQTPNLKYGFLKSLDVCVGKSLCHPDALEYREKYRTKKEELTKILYDIYNSKLFNDRLDVPVVWNKKLLNTAGRCLNKTKLRVRSSVVELSEKVLTSADRLRCTLIHELCHAATWIFNGQNGHGVEWKSWAHKANTVFPELPKISRCHQYDIEYKYTYKCTLCQAELYAHSKSKKVENLHCSYCHGKIEVFLNKKDKEGNILQTPVREPTGFAKFVKDNYKQYKKPELKHADVMKLLSNEFATLKVGDTET